MNTPIPGQRPREISVTTPLSPAIERTKQMLFKPFDLARWVTIGFCAWLAGLGESGGSGGFNYSGGDHHGVGVRSGHELEQFRHVLGRAGNYVVENFFWIVPLTITLVLLVVAVWALVLWLNCRGKFMFLHCVALDRAEVSVPWSQFAGVANSLFWFRVVLGLCAGTVTVFAVGVCGLSIAGMVLRSEANPALIAMVVLLVMGLFFLFVALAIVHKFLVDFVVPIMFLRGGSCLAAWREFLALASAQIGNFALYILFQIVLTIAIGALVLAVILLTCCVAGCLMALPFIGTVLLLPVLVFKRAYPLYYLAQYGPQFDVYPPAAPIPAAG